MGYRTLPLRIKTPQGWIENPAIASLAAPERTKESRTANKTRNDCIKKAHRKARNRAATKLAGR